MIVNVWLALRDDAQALVRERLAWDEETQGEYSGPVLDRAVRIFRMVAHLDAMGHMYRVDTPVSRAWSLWSLYFDKPVSMLLKVKDELDWLVATYTDRVKIGAAWHYSDGRQVGTTIEYDEDGAETGMTGTPTYSLDSRLLEFMPNIVIRDTDGNITSSERPTELSDVNLLQGQKERRFG